MYVKPYYDARDGRLEQINVNKDIDALLLKNTQKDFESAVNIIEKKVDFVSPMTMFALSARAYDFGLRDEAVKMVLSWAKSFNHCFICVGFR